jgi:hypothetical protein
LTGVLLTLILGTECIPADQTVALAAVDLIAAERTLMIIGNFGVVNSSDASVYSATVSWEDQDYPNQELIFETCDVASGRAQDPDEPCGDAFLAACYPLAAAHGEARVRIEAPPCPMLVEGLYTAHAWWTSWGGMPSPAPSIETPSPRRGAIFSGARRAAAFVSGGVDGLHMLMRNRRLYRSDDSAYIRDALFIQGFDIGKRARDPEDVRYQMILRRLEPLAADLDLRIVQCRSNLRHLPSKRDFWEERHSGPALAAVGHAALVGSCFLFVGASYPISDAVPWGSHPAVDSFMSSQRITIVHDGSRFSRLQKVRDLASWPAALTVLRVCPVGAGARANCGECEKCLRTRLELLAAGIEETEALGPSLIPAEAWNKAVQGPLGARVAFYKDLIEPLRARGYDELCRVLERKITTSREQAQGYGY